MEKYSVYEVVEQAIQTEKLGSEFYTEMARRFQSDSDLKKLFETLSAKEQMHEKTFQELKSGMEDDKLDYGEEASQYLRAVVESEFFLGRGKSLPALESVSTAIEAVFFAIGFEKETLLYYHAISEAVKEKDVMDKIINEERSHIVWLNKLKTKLMVNSQ
jgi:rubrerythrin